MTPQSVYKQNDGMPLIYTNPPLNFLMYSAL